MHRDDLLTQVRICARLHGRNQARRVVRAVMQALEKRLSPTAFAELAAQLPADIGVTMSGRHIEQCTAQQLIREVAEELHVPEPDAAFYLRVTFEQLNAFCRGVTPAQLAALLPGDLRGLLSARSADPAQRPRQFVLLLAPAVATLTLKAPDREPTPQPVRRKVRAALPNAALTSSAES